MVLSEIGFMDEALRGWFERTARTEHWRVAQWMSVGDLVQEAYVCYLRCLKGYVSIHPNSAEPTPDDRRQFMAYFKRAFLNKITTLARKNAREMAYSDGFRATRPLDKTAEAGEESGAFEAVVLEEARPKLAAMLVLIGLGTNPSRYRLRRRVSEGRRCGRELDLDPGQGERLLQRARNYVAECGR